VALLEQALSALRARRRRRGTTSTLAVRASPTRSLPGALLTRLDVADDIESVVRAVADVLASASAPAVLERLSAERLTAPEQPWVGVLVQRQLRFDAGDFGAVVFTHDTHSGRRGCTVSSRPRAWRTWSPDAPSRARCKGAPARCHAGRRAARGPGRALAAFEPARGKRVRTAARAGARLLRGATPGCCRRGR
jgi:hypothetical protein